MSNCERIMFSFQFLIFIIFVFFPSLCECVATFILSPSILLDSLCILFDLLSTISHDIALTYPFTCQFVEIGAHSGQHSKTKSTNRAQFTVIRSDLAKQTNKSNERLYPIFTL